MSIKTYCGNNKAFSGLLSGTHVIGTNYQCLQKGIGLGFNKPYDPEYNKPYVPIDTRKFYCGLKDKVPKKYFAVGSPSKCLQKGVGVGKKLKNYTENKKEIDKSEDLDLSFSFKDSKDYSYLYITIISIIPFLILYTIKPFFIKKLDKDKKYVIDWGKFMCYYICITVLFLFLYFTFIYFK